MQKAVIFDWSGTLSDDRLPVYAACKQILHEFGIELPPLNEWIREVKTTFAEYLAPFDVDPKEVSKLYPKKYKEITSNGTKPSIYPDSKDSLILLSERKIQTAVLSSHPQQSLEEEAEDYGINIYFKKLAGNSRNKSEDLKKLCKTMKFSSESVYIGDTIHDINAAKKAGLQSAGVSSGYHSKEMLEETRPSIGVFNTLTDFLKTHFKEFK